LLEVVVLIFESGDEMVIHAMRARKQYLDLLVTHHRAADPIDKMCTQVPGVKRALCRSAMTFGHA
jgi:hypothetical protein